MPNTLRKIEQEIGETIHDVYEGLSEEELLRRSRHKELEHVILYIRNVAVVLAVLLFAISLFFVGPVGILKSLGYFLGSGAYFCEILLLTDCFRRQVPHSEMFMAYCFGPMYVLLGISYLVGH